MKWEIIGTKGGQRGRWQIEASSLESAGQKAAKAGVDVQDIRQVVPVASMRLTPVNAPPRPAAPVAHVRPIPAAAPVAVMEYAGPQQPAVAPVFVQQNMLPQQKGTSGFGVAALVLGIIAVVFCWIPFVGLFAIPIALIGLILGIVGLIVSATGRKSGVGMPVAGSVICGVGVVLPLIITVALGAALSKARQDAQRVRSLNNLRQIGMGLILWNDAHPSGPLPASLDDLLTKQNINPADAISPITGTRYHFLPKPAVPSPQNRNVLIGYEDSSDGGGGAAVFADGHAEYLLPDEYKKVTASGKRS